MLGLLVLGAAWALASWSLWQTRVPDGLELPTLEAGRLFDSSILERAESYERFLRFDFLASQLVLLVVLALYAWRGAAFARESAAGRIGTGMLLGMIGLALVWSSQVPFRLAETWWDRRYDQTDAGYVATLFENWVALGAEFLFICFALLIVMALAGRFPRRWWIAAAPAFIGLAALFAFVTPYLFPTEPAGAALQQDAGRFARAQGMEPPRISVQDVSDFTDTPNAYAAGFGSSRRVVLWSTLLDGRFTDDEVNVVLAHELGHHSRNHILEGLAWYALFALPGAWLIAVATRRRGGMRNPAAVPISLLVLVVLQFVSLPLQNSISRHMEVEADWVALETTHDPGAARGIFGKFTTLALSDPDPPSWSEALLGSHPSVLERIELTEAWRDRNR